jgi:hypothetical protein
MYSKVLILVVCALAMAIVVHSFVYLSIDAASLGQKCPHRRIVAMMSILDNALTLITLLSLFLLGPALGRAMVACLHGWQDWSLPIQHLAVGICTMIAVTGMVLAYGALWKLSPKSVAWYTWNSSKCQWPAM